MSTRPALSTRPLRHAGFHGRPQRSPRSVVSHLRGLLPVVLLAGGAAALFGALAIEKPSRSPSAPQTAPKKVGVTVKRPLPPGMTEDQVAKWMPIRQVSGRTELAPWTSVDGATGADPDALARALYEEGPAPSEAPAPKPSVPEREDQEKPTEQPATQPKTDAQPKPAPEPSGLIDRLRARFSPVKAAPNAPRDTKQVPEHVQSRPPQT